MGNNAPRPQPTREPQIEDIPGLVETMMTKKGTNKSAAAVKRIYQLCDVGHKQNRVPMVCSREYDVLTPLAQFLTHSGDELHMACLALNNLSVPQENKPVMAFGPLSSVIMEGLCKVIAAKDSKESYLCIIILMNLSFLEASITPMLQHSPIPGGSDPIPPLSNSGSLLRILEKLLGNASTVPSAGPKRRKPITSPEEKRWACGLIKNLAKSEENASLFEETNIPKYIVENLRDTAILPSRWTTNSLEDFSLFIILNLAQWPVSRYALVHAGAINLLQPITVQKDIQGLKAAMACALLGALWGDFPVGGSAAAAESISELLTNITEKKDKSGQYAHGVFKLEMAMKAYQCLCDAANSAGHAIPEISLAGDASSQSKTPCEELTSMLIDLDSPF